MLNSDIEIFDLLIKEKNEGNEILKHFHIGYPSPQIAREANSIFIASVSTEPSKETMQGALYRDLVEILIVTKIKDHERAKKVIKMVIKELIRIIKNHDGFTYRPVIRNIAPEYNSNFILNKGHIMVECETEAESIGEHELAELDRIIMGEVETDE